MADITTKYKSKWTGKEIDEGIEKAKNAVPLDGSKAMTGALKSPNGIAVNKLRLEEWGSGEAFIRFYDRNGNGSRYISMWDKTKTNSLKAALLFAEEINGVYTTNQILHTGNKPSGSYTGNGSAARREIPIGMIGSVLAILGSNTVALVINAAGFARNNSGLRDLAGGNIFINSAGNAVLTTTDPALNENGVTYTYFAL